MAQPRACDETLDYLAAQIDARTPLPAFCLAAAPLLADAALVRPVLEAYVALAADAPPPPPPPIAPMAMAADVAVAAALARPGADHAAHWLAHAAGGDGRLDAPRADPAFAAAAVAFGAHELLGRVAALDARAAAAPAAPAAEAALARYMASVAATDASALTADHWRALGLLAVPRGAELLLDALVGDTRAFFEYRVAIAADPVHLLGVVVGEDAAAVRDPFAAWRARGPAPAGWRAVLAAQLPAAHAALSLVAADDRRFTRAVVRLIGDAAWDVAAPVPHPTFVLLGARAYVLAGGGVVAHAGPGAALAAWRGQLRAALGLTGPDRLSPFFGDALP